MTCTDSKLIATELRRLQKLASTVLLFLHSFYSTRSKVTKRVQVSVFSKTMNTLLQCINRTAKTVFWYSSCVKISWNTENVLSSRCNPAAWWNESHVTTSMTLCAWICHVVNESELITSQTAVRFRMGVWNEYQKPTKLSDTSFR